MGGPSAWALLTCSLTPHYRLCSPEPLLLPWPLQKVLLQRSVLRGVEQSGDTKPFCQVSKDPLVPPRASWMAEHIEGGGGGSEFECYHRPAGAQSSCCHLAHSWSHLTLHNVLGWGAGPWEAVVRHESWPCPPSPARLTLAAPPELPIPHQVSALHLADAGSEPPGPGL